MDLGLPLNEHGMVEHRTWVAAPNKTNPFLTAMIEEYLVMHTRPLPDSHLRRCIDISQPNRDALVAGWLLRNSDEDISARTVGRIFDSFLEEEGTTLKALSTDHSKCPTCKEFELKLMSVMRRQEASKKSGLADPEFLLQLTRSTSRPSRIVARTWTRISACADSPSGRSTWASPSA